MSGFLLCLWSNEVVLVELHDKLFNAGFSNEPATGGCWLVMAPCSEFGSVRVSSLLTATTVPQFWFFIFRFYFYFINQVHLVVAFVRVF